MSYFAIIVAYMLGSIPFGYLVSKYWKGINILECGSGNIGFTNVLRIIGWPPAALVLVGDVGKGALAAWVGVQAGGEVLSIFCAMAALVGHSFSIFIKFKGGKLVATGFGVLLILTPKVAIAAAVTWLVTLAVSRYVSLASIMAALGLFVFMFVFGVSNQIKVFLAVAALFVVYKHRVNISRLMKGQEYKIGQKSGRN